MQSCFTCVIPSESKLCPQGSQGLRKQLAVPDIWVHILPTGNQGHFLGVYTLEGQNSHFRGYNVIINLKEKYTFKLRLETTWGNGNKFWL